MNVKNILLALAIVHGVDSESIRFRLKRFKWVDTLEQVLTYTFPTYHCVQVPSVNRMDIFREIPCGGTRKLRFPLTDHPLRSCVGMGKIWRSSRFLVPSQLWGVPQNCWRRVAFHPCRVDGCVVWSKNLTVGKYLPKKMIYKCYSCEVCSLLKSNLSSFNYRTKSPVAGLLFLSL